MCTLLDCGLDFSWTVCPAYSQLQGRKKGAGEENCTGIFQVLEGKKVVLMPFKNTIFQLEDSLHLLLLRAVNMAAVLSLARKKKAHKVHDKMLTRVSIVPFFSRFRQHTGLSDHLQMFRFIYSLSELVPSGSLSSQRTRRHGCRLISLFLMYSAERVQIGLFHIGGKSG